MAGINFVTQPSPPTSGIDRCTTRWRFAPSLLAIAAGRGTPPGRPLRGGHWFGLRQFQRLPCNATGAVEHRHVMGGLLLGCAFGVAAQWALLPAAWAARSALLPWALRHWPWRCWPQALAWARLDRPGHGAGCAYALSLPAMLIGGLLFGVEHSAGAPVRLPRPGAAREGQPARAGGPAVPGPGRAKATLTTCSPVRQWLQGWGVVQLEPQRCRSGWRRREPACERRHAGRGSRTRAGLLAYCCARCVAAAWRCCAAAAIPAHWWQPAGGSRRRWAPIR